MASSSEKSRDGQVKSCTSSRDVPPSTGNPWLLVFDLDGTLIDSSLDLCLSVNAALQHVGRSPLPEAEIVSYIGDGAAMLMHRALGQKVSDAVAAEQVFSPAEQALFQKAFAFFLEFYRAHKLDNTRLYPGVLRALEAIRDANAAVLMAVLTNKPVNPSREICDALGIAPFFFSIYGGNSFSTKKPEPEGLLTLIAEGRQLRQSSSDSPVTLTDAGVVMVGDSSVDVLTAQRARVRSLGCAYGLAPESLVTTPPDALCRAASEWPSLLST